MWHTKNAFFREMQFWSHCYTVGSYQALFRLSVYKFPAVYLLGAKNVCFCTIRDFGSPTTTDLYQINFAKVHNVAKWTNFVMWIFANRTMLQNGHFPSFSLFWRTIFVTIATVLVESIPVFYTLAIVLIN